MKHLIGAGLISIMLGGTAALAAEQTVKLNVKGMTCVSCPYQVQSALKKVDGIKIVDGSLHKVLAVVTYDDGKADVAALTKATTDAGFPSALVREGN